MIWNNLNFVSDSDKHDDAFILTTDADVRFTPDDVIALMDRMSRDPTVGAVCGRTHPLGSGPLVWYQVFDYAIGHWMLKVGKSFVISRNIQANGIDISGNQYGRVVVLICSPFHLESVFCYSELLRFESRLLLWSIFAHKTLHNLCLL